VSPGGTELGFGPRYPRLLEFAGVGAGVQNGARSFRWVWGPGSLFVQVPSPSD
jgi:hypothetical protein